MLLLIGASQAAQPSPAATKPAAYDTVSIRQNKSGSMSYGYRPAPNGITATNITLRNFFLQVYGPLNPRQLSGMPDWTATQRFDIEAKLDDETFAELKKLPPAEAWEVNKRRMQQILIDRFNLKVHHEQREQPVYALVVAKGGPKLKDADPDPHKERTVRSGYRDGELSVDATDMDRFARGLSNELDREVVNHTGLTGNYDITMKWAPYALHKTIRASTPRAPALLFLRRFRNSSA
jgi:uncharacterized protein (TIGR03435 family)